MGDYLVRLLRLISPIIPLLLTLLCLPACTTIERDTRLDAPDVDRVLYELGKESLENKRWLAAREYFAQVVDSYPQSSVRPQSLLGIGDTYEGVGTAASYLRAIDEFRQFLSFFPLHPQADYAQYKIALIHLAQVRSPERDQTETKAAIRSLNEFLDQYPDSNLVGEAETKLRSARDRYSESEFLVGHYYYRSKWYPGAIDRFKAILEDDPQFTLRDAVYFHLAESLLAVANKVEALPYFERLVKEFDKSEYLADSMKRVTQLKR